MATIKDLQEELLVMIFSHYIRNEGHTEFSKNIPRVCKAWNDLSSTTSLWRNVSAYNCKYLMNVSRRKLLYHTQSLELDSYSQSVSAMNLSSILKNIRDLKALVFKCTVSDSAIKPVTEHCPHLELLSLKIPNSINTTIHEWEQFLTICGPTLKDLELEYECMHRERKQYLLSGITAKCPQLERLVIFSSFAPFPIYKLRSGCPRLKELEFRDCNLITAGRDDSLNSGFKEIKKFKASFNDFSGLNISNLLKDSINLEYLELLNNKDLVLGNIQEIPSNNVRVLKIMLRYPDENLKVIGDAMSKWGRTLSILKLNGWECEISKALQYLLLANPNPELKSFECDIINRRFLKKFIQKCQNLIHLKVNWKTYEGREEIERSFVLSREQEEITL